MWFRGFIAKGKVLPERQKKKKIEGERVGVIALFLQERRRKREHKRKTVGHQDV